MRWLFIEIVTALRPQAGSALIADRKDRPALLPNPLCLVRKGRDDAARVDVILRDNQLES